MHFSDLVAELTASQIHQVLSLFGAQRTTSIIPVVRAISLADKAIMAPGGDYENVIHDPDYPSYQCVGRATCEESVSRICMHSC